MGRREPRNTKRHVAGCCKTAHTGLWTDLTPFEVLHLWETKGGPTTWTKCVTHTGICSMLLLALDVWKLQHCNKIQVLTGWGMGYLRGISDPCKSDRVLLACSSWTQLLMKFLDSLNFIRNWKLPIRNVQVPQSQLVWSSPPVIQEFTSHLPGPPVTKVNSGQLLCPPVTKLIISHLPGPPVISLNPRQLSSPPVIWLVAVMILVTAKLLKSPGHATSFNLSSPPVISSLL
jgi:hypothetical protein